MTVYAQDLQTYTPDELIAGGEPVTQTVVITTSAALTRGAVLGIVTASGNYLLSASAASDGSENPRAILAEDVDASAADQRATVYVTGEFHKHALNFGAGHDADSVRDDLASYGMYLKVAV